MNKSSIHIRSKTAGKVRVRVDSATGSYDVLYGSELIGKLRGHLSAALPRDSAAAGIAENTGIFVLSSPRVSRHWQAKIMRGIGARTVRATVLFDDRERMKNIATV